MCQRRLHEWEEETLKLWINAAATGRPHAPSTVDIWFKAKVYHNTAARRRAYYIAARKRTLAVQTLLQSPFTKALRSRIERFGETVWRAQPNYHTLIKQVVLATGGLGFLPRDRYTAEFRIKFICARMTPELQEHFSRLLRAYADFVSRVSASTGVEFNAPLLSDLPRAVGLAYVPRDNGDTLMPLQDTAADGAPCAFCLRPIARDERVYYITDPVMLDEIHVATGLPFRVRDAHRRCAEHYVSEGQCALCPVTNVVYNLSRFNQIPVYTQPIHGVVTRVNKQLCTARHLLQRVRVWCWTDEDDEDRERIVDESFDESDAEEGEEGFITVRDVLTAEGLALYMQSQNAPAIRVTANVRLVGYHSAPRPWRNGDIPAGAIGVELEVGFKNGENGRAKFLSEHVDPNGRFRTLPFSVEHDGSLAGVPGGCEIISDPLPLRAGYQATDAPWRVLLKHLYDAGAEGWKHRQHAGLHVNMDVSGRKDEDIIKYSVFINNADKMSQLIAGRRNIYNGHYDKFEFGMLDNCTPESMEPALSSAYRRGKYAAVHRRNERCLETRIFGSNIRYEGFMACIEYCVAVMQYTSQRPVWMAFSPTAPAEFRSWLGDQRRHYPNLCKRLGIVAHRPTADHDAVPSNARIVPERLCA